MLDREEDVIFHSVTGLGKESGVILVYCVKCGAKNPDDAAICAQCGKPVMEVERGRTRREDEMCFGLPRHWGGILVGLFIIILGMAMLFRTYLRIEDFWPLILIFVGLAVLLGGLYRYTRR